ncbi:MAG: NPCBM/NEW2 domain-containing protein [Pirellulales bacterium]|nr:NPCBM/NEW2 domain-containing protein [Pirellulales bacterium]
MRYAIFKIASRLPVALIFALGWPTVCAAAPALGPQASTQSAALAGTIPITVTIVAGQELTGSMTAWTAAGLAIRVGDPPDEEEIEIANDQLLQVVREQALSSAAEGQPHVILVDGSRLPMARYEVADRKASIWSPLAPDSLTLDTEHVARVQLLPDPEGAAAIGKRLDEERLVGDVLVLKKKEAAPPEFLAGVIGNVNAEKVDFQWDGERIPVKLSKIAALAYYHAQTPQAARPVCVLTTRHGARLPAAGIRLSGGVLQLTTVGGVDLEIPIEAIHRADYSAGKLTYLSDMTPVYQKWTPRIGLPHSAALIQQHGLPRMDQSYSGSLLSLVWPATEDGSLGGEVKVYAKGLALRSHTELRYRLPDGMRRFICLAGIAPATSSEGNVSLTILARGGPGGAATGRTGPVAARSEETRQIWHGEIAGGAAPVEIDVELRGAKELQVQVDYGSNHDFGDRLHLVEARVSK